MFRFLYFKNKKLYPFAINENNIALILSTVKGIQLSLRIIKIFYYSKNLMISYFFKRHILQNKKSSQETGRRI